MLIEAALVTEAAMAILTAAVEDLDNNHLSLEAVAALETLTEIEADLVEALAAAVCVAATVDPHNSAVVWAVVSEEATAEEWAEDSVADSDSNLLCLAVVD